MSYKLDTNSAKAADNIASSISTAGKYIGTITRAEYLTADSGARGLGVSFKTDDGATADYLDIYTHNGAGEPLPGAKVVNAIMACTALRDLSDGKIVCEKWSKQSNSREKFTVPGAPELMGKRIGFLLQEEYGTYNGKETHKMLIFGVFSADTEMTASEILERKTTPVRLSKMVEALHARSVRDNRKRQAGGSRQQPSSGGGRDDPFDDMDSDIPFN